MSTIMSLWGKASVRARAWALGLLARSLTSTRGAHLDLRGVYPPIVTPFNNYGGQSISWDRLATNFALWNQLPFKGYLVQGSNGEYVLLSMEERIEMVKKVRELTPKDKLVLAGSGCESTKATVDLTQKMAQAGADAVVIVTPSYFRGRMNAESYYKYYTEIADESPVPVILYSVPANTGIDLPTDAIIRLAGHPNIIGLKDSGGDIAKLGFLVNEVKDADFQILAGSASFLLPALTLGCVGGICALANVLGDAVCELMSLHERGDLIAASNLQRRLIAPNAAVTRKFGVAGLKKSMDWNGYYGGLARRPLLPLLRQEEAGLKKDFADNGF